MGYEHWKPANEIADFLGLEKHYSGPMGGLVALESVVGHQGAEKLADLRILKNESQMETEPEASTT